MREQLLQQKIRAIFNKSGSGARFWRNNVGAYKLPDGGYLTYGLATGSGDLIGIRSLVITPEMIGKTVGVFASGEIKTPEGRVSSEQLVWQKTVREFGGIAEFFRSEEQAKQWMRAGLVI